MKKLPKMFRGASVVRGKGMKMSAVEKLTGTHAVGAWSDSVKLFVVVADEMDQFFSDVKAFTDKAKAIRFAQACSNGNVNHRVLTVTAQTLVVATENEL